MDNTSLLQQAQAIAEQGDWGQLSHHLQKMLLADPAFPLTPAAKQQMLTLALHVLEAGDFQERWDVAKVFPAFGSAAIPPLTTLLQDEDAELETRWFAARILGQFDSPETIQTLIQLLQQSEDEELRLVATETLAHLGPAAIAALTELLPDTRTRPFAVQALTQIRRSETIAPLLTVVTDDEPTIRAIVIEALGSFHDPRIPPLLVQALTDTAARVRRAAVTSLGVRTDLVESFDLVKHLSDRLWDLNLDVCQQAAIALGRLGTTAAAAALWQVLQSPHTPLPLQLETVRALGWAGSMQALEYLHQALSLPVTTTAPPTLYQEIITVLGRWADPDLKPRTSEILINALASTHEAINHPLVKQAIALALGHLAQPVALPSLVQLLADSDVGVQLHAIAALKNLDSPTTRHQLNELASRTDLPAAMRQGVAIALQEWNRV